VTTIGKSDADQPKKLRYAHEANARFHEVAVKLAGVTARIRSAVATGDLEMSEQLIQVQRQAEIHLATVERRLKQLEVTDDESWQRQKQILEDGWEDLLRSMKNIVARLS
jgi:hypothetical protein